nr:M20 family metallopeptidase [Thermococcus barophilus]
MVIFVEVELLKKLVSTPSHFGEEKEISEFITSFLEPYAKVETQEVEGFGSNVIAYLKGVKNTVVLNGHMDTVGLSAGWTKNPWGQIEGDKFYGLGSADMKGGLAALMSVFAEIAELSRRERPNVIFTAVVDEEGYSRGTWELIKSKKLEKADVVLVGEPTNEKLMLGARGRFVIQVKAFGKKAHAARPENGINAIEELSKLLANLNRAKLKKHRKLGKGSFCTLEIEGKADGLSVPEYAKAIVDRHTVVGEDWEFVRETLEKLAQKLEIKAKLKIEKFKRPTPEMLPYYVKENLKVVKIFKRIFKQKTGKDVEVTYGKSVGDFNYFGTYLGKPTLVFGPIGGNWHSADEWVSISSVKRVKEIYRDFLKALV